MNAFKDTFKVQNKFKFLKIQVQKKASSKIILKSSEKNVFYINFKRKFILTKFITK